MREEVLYHIRARHFTPSCLNSQHNLDETLLALVIRKIMKAESRFYHIMWSDPTNGVSDNSPYPQCVYLTEVSKQNGPFSVVTYGMWLETIVSLCDNLLKLYLSKTSDMLYKKMLVDQWGKLRSYLFIPKQPKEANWCSKEIRSMIWESYF